jgi:hypothetical protein
MLLCSITGAMAENNSEAAVTVENERYSVLIETPKAYISGLCILHETDSEVIGSIMNEFGFSAMTFIMQKANHKIELQNVIKFLDKWYIKRVIKNDLRIILLHGKGADKKHIYEKSEGMIKLRDTKYKLTYTLNRLESDEGGSEETEIIETGNNDTEQ